MRFQTQNQPPKSTKQTRAANPSGIVRQAKCKRSLQFFREHAKNSTCPYGLQYRPKPHIKFDREFQTARDQITRGKEKSLPSRSNKENLITLTGNVLLINLRIWKKIPCTLQRNTRTEAHNFNDKLSRDSGLDAMNATNN